jgi:hypothetical protein
VGIRKPFRRDLAIVVRRTTSYIAAQAAMRWVKLGRLILDRLGTPGGDRAVLMMSIALASAPMMPRLNPRP